MAFPAPLIILLSHATIFAGARKWSTAKGRAMGRKRRRRDRAPAMQGNDYMDKGTAQFQAKVEPYFVTEKTKDAYHKRVVVQVPLQYYHTATKAITRTQYRAGHRFYCDWRAAGYEFKSSPSLDVVKIPPRQDKAMTSRQQDALDSFRAAQAAIQGKSGRILAEHVCCYGFLVKDVALPYSCDTRYLMPRLKEALDDLALHYGFTVP